MGTIAVQYMSYERYPKTSHPGAFGSSFITAGFALKTTDLANSRADLFGSELADYMKRAARGLAGIKTFGEEQPNMENRVELSSAKDEFGMPMGKLIHSYDQDAVALWNANLEEGLKVAKASGAKEAWSSRGSIPWAPVAPIPSSTAMARATKFRTFGSRDQASFPPRAHPIRRLQYLHCRSVAPSAWHHSGEA
jgi:hypothetical protein